MKNFLQNLLIFFAAGLCVLVAVQWHRETQGRVALDQLERAAQRDRETLQNLRADLGRAEAEATRLTRLNETNAGAVAELPRLRAELEQRTEDLQQASTQLQDYEAALAKANASIKQQNESVAAQNEEMKKLTAERNDAVLRLNEVARQYNDLAARWNALQAQQSTNPAPAPAPER
jgi:chromosome segregation ATPase